MIDDLAARQWASLQHYSTTPSLHYSVLLGESWLEQLFVVRGRVRERIIDSLAISRRSVHNTVEIFLHINLLYEQPFAPHGLGVFDQNSRRPVDAPHPK